MPASSSHIHADLKNQAIEAACKKLPARPGYEFGRNRNVLSAIFRLLSMTSGTLRAELVFRTNSALALRRHGDHRWYITPDELRFLRLCRTANRSTKWLMAQCAEGKVARAEKRGRRVWRIAGKRPRSPNRGEADLRAKPVAAGAAERWPSATTSSGLERSDKIQARRPMR